MNLLFGCKLTAYDIDFVMGRQSVRLQQLGQKLIMAECWHNTDWVFSRMVRDLADLVRMDRDSEPELDGWVKTGIQIGVLFGIFGELIRCGMASEDHKIDVSLVSGDFSGPMAAWYARAMGLPIGNIVCCCNENENLWNFICHGKLCTDGIARQTIVPEGDVVVPEGLERLISIFGGPEETDRYVSAVRSGETYYVEETLLQRMRKGIYVTVTSQKRILTTIPNAYGTHKYLMPPASALAYAGLQNYRAKTGEMRTALIMTHSSPAVHYGSVAAAMGISEQELDKLM